MSRHLDAGRLINFFIWHSSCCQLHTSVPIKDKMTVSMFINIHAAAFSLGCFPAQRCGAVYCHVLKSLHLDVALTSFQTSFHMQLSRSSRPGIVWALPRMLVTLDVPASTQQICPGDCTVLSVLACCLECATYSACSCWPTSAAGSRGAVSKHGLLFGACLAASSRADGAGALRCAAPKIWKWPHIFQILKFIFRWMKASIRPAQPQMVMPFVRKLGR